MFCSSRTGWSICAAWIVACFLEISRGYPSGNASSYDQRQTGDYNIHISLKDIKIFALLSGGLGNSEDYDYNYDYAEMTVKPLPALNKTNSSATTMSTTTTKPNMELFIPSTTEKVVEITPSPVTTKPPTIVSYANNQNATYNPIAYNNSMGSIPKPIILKPNQNAGIPVEIVVTPVQVLSDSHDRKNVTSLIVESTTVAAVISSNATRKLADCAEGYRRDVKGNCRPKLRKQPQQTLLRKLIQLSQRMHNAKQQPQ